MNITIYTKSNCPNCVAAKRLMQEHDLDYTEISLDEEGRRNNFMAAYPDARQMPQIFYGESRLGGLEGLKTYLPQILSRKDDWK